MQAVDRVISRVLFISQPVVLPADGAAELESAPVVDEAAERAAENAFGISLFMSGLRCVVKYILLPFVLPIIGITGNFGALVSVAINVVAIGAIIYSLRRFWIIDYKRKYQYLGVALVALVLLSVFMVFDLTELFTGVAGV